jgi:hypothetical protein
LLLLHLLCALVSSARASPAAARVRLAFADEYACVGAAFDEPQRMRLQCRRAPARLAECLCSPSGGGWATASSLACSCGAAAGVAGAPPLPLGAPAVGTVEAARLREPVRWRG